ncbi:uncharacterized protein JCM6883_001410 [Sporobolomyces salmoneus]|uniref:uncharacterized protein n=1 Tax=Sporobolomyces salmoneus TaxID=183962 RepID=UPI003178034D
MTSITALGYGLTVRATDLITAAQAWPALEPTFKFFDLLFLRKRNGSLASRGSLQGLIEDVPVEVWEEVRQRVVQCKMVEAENRFLGQFLGSRHGPGCDCIALELEENSWDYLRRKGMPEWLDDHIGFSDAFRNFKQGDAAAFAVSSNCCLCILLGLSLIQRVTTAYPPPHWLIWTCPSSRENDYPQSRKLARPFDDVALLTIPSRAQRSDSSYSTISAEAGYDQQDEHTLVNVSLDLPSDANIRFSRFIRTFRLSIVEISDTTLRHVAPDPEAKGNSRKGLAGIKRSDARVVKEVKPRWMLYTSCWVDW